MRNFRIGTTDVLRWRFGELSKHIRVCHDHKTQIPRGATVVFKCETIGRHLYIQQMINEYLSLCEVEVYGHRVGMYTLMLFGTVMHVER